MTVQIEIPDKYVRVAMDTISISKNEDVSKMREVIDRHGDSPVIIDNTFLEDESAFLMTFAMMGIAQLMLKEG